MSIYEISHRVNASDADVFRRLRLSRLFLLMQEAAGEHSELLDVGKKRTTDRGYAWIITRYRAEITRMPMYDESFTLRTWPGRGMYGLYPRFFSLIGGEGETLLRVSSQWAVMELDARRVVLPGESGILVPEEKTGGELSLPRPIRGGAETNSAPFTVPLSYLDMNGHMNNTRYFDLMEDTLPPASEGRALRELTVEYKSELRLGERVTLLWGEDDGEWSLSCESFRMRVRYT